MKGLRILIALLIVDWILGTPGLGVETRTSGTNNDVMNWVYTVVGLGLLAALAFTWFRPAWAKPLAMAVGAIAVVLAVADMTGLTSSQAAPPAMIAVDLGGIGRTATLPA
jgi:FtsH-binding integral membrane protein